MNTLNSDVGRELFVGIDVGKLRLDIACGQDGEAYAVDNTDTGINALVVRLQALCEGTGPTLVVMEASGGYERIPLALLAKAGIKVALVPPKRTRDFARSAGLLAKTDRIDARMLAHFGERMRPPVRALAPAAHSELCEFLARRVQLVAMRTMEKQRLAQALSKKLQKLILGMIKFIDKQIAALEKDLDGWIEKQDAWRVNVALLSGTPGVGPATARSLVVRLPELGKLSEKAIAALVGVAPVAHDSGSHTGKRRIKAGRSDVRTALFQATISAVRCNPPVMLMYKRLRAAGKPTKVALIACEHKLLNVLNAIIRTQTPWRNTTLQTA